MCVPAHDQRDYEFAEKYGLPVKDRDSAGAGRAAARRSDERGVHRVRAPRRFGPVHRTYVRAGDRKNDRRRRSQEVRRGRNDVPAEGLGNFAAAVLGHADPGDLLRKRRHGAGSGRSACPCACRNKWRSRPARAIAARKRAGIREHEMSEVRRPGAARNRHDGHVRRFVVVFLPLHRPAQRPARRSTRRRPATGFRSTSTSAESSTPFCTCSTRDFSAR